MTPVAGLGLTVNGQVAALVFEHGLLRLVAVVGARNLSPCLIVVVVRAGVAWFSAASLLLPVALSEPVRAAALALPAVLLARMCVVSHLCILLYGMVLYCKATIETSSTVVDAPAGGPAFADSFAAFQPAQHQQATNAQHLKFHSVLPAGTAALLSTRRC